jgi:hypothetical protein
MEYYRRLISLTTLDRKKKSLPSSPLRSLRPRVYNPKHTTKQIARGTPKDRKDGWCVSFCGTTLYDIRKKVTLGLVVWIFLTNCFDTKAF